MKKVSTTILRIVIIVAGLLLVGGSLWAAPYLLDWNNVGSYFPVLAVVYLSTIPLYIGLFQTLTILNYIDQNKAFSKLSIKALKAVKYSAIAFSLLYTAVSPYTYYVVELDDAPGVLLVNLILIGASAVFAVFVAVLQKLLQNALDIKKENELTV